MPSRYNTHLSMLEAPVHGASTHIASASEQRFQSNLSIAPVHEAPEAAPTQVWLVAGPDELAWMRRQPVA
jgi:hypothetical protein